MIRNLVWLLVAMVIGMVLAYALIPSDPIVYNHVIIPAARIIEREPDTVRTFIDRIRFIEAPARQVAVAPGGAQGQVQAFCQPIIATLSDTVGIGPIVDPMLLLRSVRYERRWSVRKDRLFVAGPTNYGDLVAHDYEVRGDFTLAMVGDRPLVQYPRTSLLYDIWEGGSQVYTGYKIAETLIGMLK